MSPITPPMVRALLISEDDSWCVTFQKLLQSFWYCYKLAKYFWDADGNLTTQDADATFGQDICAADCPDA